MSHLGNLEYTRINHAFAYAGPCYLECTAACYSQLRVARLFHMHIGDCDHFTQFLHFLSNDYTMQQVSGVTRHHVTLTIVINITYSTTAQMNQHCASEQTVSTNTANNEHNYVNTHGSSNNQKPIELHLPVHTHNFTKNYKGL